MEKTFSKEIIRGTELNVLIIGKREGMEEVLKEFDIFYDIILTKDELIEKYKKNHYEIIFIGNDYLEKNIEKNDLSELIDIIRKNDKNNNTLIVGLMNNEDKHFRNILNSNNVELVLFKPVQAGQMIVILRNDFNWKIIRNFTEKLN
ncbi:MAG: hypothetical protein IJA34_17005 [Lachnospiraceae bacterium]|nr:hypothetical protein [Lachnospiraceae bacterium]